MVEKRKYFSSKEWDQLKEDQQREHNQRVHGIETSYRVREIPYVPNIVRGLPFKLHPVKA